MKKQETSSYSKPVRILCWVLVALMLLGVIYSAVLGFQSLISDDGKETKKAEAPAVNASYTLSCVTDAPLIC